MTRLGATTVDQVDIGERPTVTPTDRELERAIASVPGVEHASVLRDAGHNRLRLRLIPGEDATLVSWSVAATLRERFGIALDPGSIRRLDRVEPTQEPFEVVNPGQRRRAAARAVAALERGPREDGTVPGRPGGTEGDRARTVTVLDPARASGPRVADEEPVVGEAGFETTVLAVRGSSERGAPRRVAVRHIGARRGPRQVQVVVTLEHLGRLGQGAATNVPTARGRYRAVAEATASAVSQLSADGLLVGVDRVGVRAAGDPATATVVLSLLSRHGEETLVGSALVRDDTDEAVMRATLDALNRRVAELLPGPVVLG